MPALAHLGIGLATKRYAPEIPLWVLLIGSMLLDLPYFFFITMPLWITHGLIMSIVWTLGSTIGIAGILTYLNSKKNQDWSVYRVSIIFGLLVFSHWILDFIGWPMTIGDPNATGVPIFFDDLFTIGLGVYSTLAGALIMDLGVFILGFVVYYYARRNLKVTS